MARPHSINIVINFPDKETVSSVSSVVIIFSDDHSCLVWTLSVSTAIPSPVTARAKSALHCGLVPGVPW